MLSGGARGSRGAPDWLEKRYNGPGKYKPNVATVAEGLSRYPDIIAEALKYISPCTSSWSIVLL